MFTQKELITALDYLYLEAKRSESIYKELPKEYDVLFYLVSDSIEGGYTCIDIKKLKESLSYFYFILINTHGIVPIWLQVGYTLLVQRLKKELNGKEN